MTELRKPEPVVAGGPVRGGLIAVLAIAVAGWMIWATRTLIVLRERRIVSVSLSSLVRDFVAAEARAPQAGEASAARTRAYLAAVDHAVSALGRDGTVVLVSEATLGRSVPDATGMVRREIARTNEARDAGR